MITINELLQLLGVVLSFAVVAKEFVTLIRDWRGGSPELRALRDTLRSIQSEQVVLLRQILHKL